MVWSNAGRINPGWRQGSRHLLRTGWRKSCLNYVRFLSKSQSLCFNYFFPVYKSLCLDLFQNFIPSSYNAWSLTPQRGCPAHSCVQCCSCSSFLTEQCMQPCTRIPLSLPATLHCSGSCWKVCNSLWCTEALTWCQAAQTILPLAAFLHFAKGENKQTRWRGTCALSRHRDLTTPRDLGDVWMQLKGVQHRAGGHSQPGFKLITAGSVVLALCCSLAAQMLSQDPSKAVQPLWSLTSLHTTACSTWTAQLLDSSDMTSQWNLLISKADTPVHTHQLWIFWPPDWHCDIYAPVPSFQCSMCQHHRANLLSQLCCGSAALVKSQKHQTSLFEPPWSYHAGEAGPSAALPLKRWNLGEAFCNSMESTSMLDPWSIRGILNWKKESLSLHA